MFELLAIFGILIFVAIAWRDIVWGISLLIVLLPSYLWRLEFFGLPSTFLELLILSLFTVWLVKNYSKINWKLKKPLINPVPSIWRLILIFWLVASLIALVANPIPAALGLWRAYFLEPILFFLVFVYSVNGSADYRKVVNSFVILVAGLFIFSLYQYFTDWNLPAAYNYPNIKRLTAVFSYPNALALLLAPISSYLFGSWLVSVNKKNNWWLAVTALIGFVLCYLAKSEGAMIAIIFSVLFYLIFDCLYQRNKAAAWIFTALFIIITPLTSYWQNISQQIIHPRTVPPTSSLEIRGLQWQETWQLLQDNFITGSGLAGYREAMINYHKITWLEIYLYPHNLFLNFWTELGLFGLLIFIWILSYLAMNLRKLWQQKNQLAWPLIMAWLTLLIHGLVDVPYFKNDLSVLFFILVGLTIFATNHSLTSSEQTR